MKPTVHQLLAISHDGENILVSAGAGSGKTAVLTERVMAKLSKGILIDDLIILTFTNAAAA
ncbi:MAG: UvrD-helicase domain-containing protein, partial [Candidatus Izemoplasmatales bacterium]|nr:UvrD-helicase domain-containing protein [Candidatus Izemoplasmatales bacterium]